MVNGLAETSHFLDLTNRHVSGSLREMIERRGKYGLTNFTYTTEIRSFLRYFGPNYKNALELLKLLKLLHPQLP